jgi:uncharacterized protein YcnI
VVVPRALMLRRSLIAAALAGLVLAAPASAHVEVRPTSVAPADPVLFTVLVPGERESGTTEIKLQIPEGVLPFSFEDQAGWKRTTQEAANGALESVTWKGEAAPDGLVALRFLASTPEKPGTITWKSIQTYEDGTVVRWIGDASSESPASTTTVSADAPRENAGGEGEETPSTGGTAAPEATPDATADSAGPATTDTSSDEGRDGLTLGLAIAGLLAALAALGVASTRGRSAA